jgi:hypothetical protein
MAGKHGAQRDLEGMDALLDLPMDEDCLDQLLRGGGGGSEAAPADKAPVPRPALRGPGCLRSYCGRAGLCSHGTEETVLNH